MIRKTCECGAEFTVSEKNYFYRKCEKCAMAERPCRFCGQMFKPESAGYYTCPECYAQLFANGFLKRQCQGTTSAGERCQIHVRNATGYCAKHEPPILVNAHNWLEQLVVGIQPIRSINEAK